MCGIAGIFNYGSQEKLNHHDLERITGLLTHRGPDEAGYFCNHQIGLGHRRLSIIDLTTGHQPIYNEDKTIVTIFNGEIYNFIELKETLMKKGHRFETHSDTEVIVHLYEEYGEDFVEHLRGMFAVALWDASKKKLCLVRDRLGIKPLFYFVDHNKILFASEIKSIVQYPGFEKKIALEALHDYLSFMTTTGRKTIFAGVLRLLPGEMLVCTQEKITQRFYWEPEKIEKRKVYSAQEFLEQLQEVVKGHLISDVPLGAFLSGGLDSSTVVALMSRVMDKPVKTFSIGFTGSKYYDETPYARRVAEYLKTDHQEFIVTPRVVDVIPDILKYFDEPFAVSSAIPTYFLAKLAREKVKVVLTGDGADELLAGYDYRYWAIRLGEIYDRFPLLKGIPLPQLLGGILKGKKAKLEKFYSQLHVNPRLRYFSYMTKFQEENKRQLYSDSMCNQIGNYDSSRDFCHYYDQLKDDDVLNRWLYVDMKTSLPDEMLTKVDRMTMAFGLEARVPFLDHKLVEYVLSLPSSEKLKGRTSKYILRRAIAAILPPDILKRPKHGFEVPVDEWIRGELKDYARDYLNKQRIDKEGIFSGSMVESILQDHLTHKKNYGHQLWSLLMFEVWYEKYFR